MYIVCTNTKTQYITLLIDNLVSDLYIILLSYAEFSVKIIHNSQC